MADTGVERTGAPNAAATPAGGEPRRLPAVVRHAIIIVSGASLAGLTSYLLRTIGF